MKKKNTITTVHLFNVDNKPKEVVRDVSDFLNKDYREYAHYVIETRALPSVIDGFKVGARKMMHAAFKGSMKNGAEVKNINLAGDIYNYTLYMHGDASIHTTILTEAAEFSDNLNPITIAGQHGSLRDPKAAASPRYLYCKLSPFAKLYKVDEDLLEYTFDEGVYLEPYYYLPIIPTILCSRTEGMAPGYKYSCFSYNPIDIIDACIEYIKKNEIQTVIRPYVRGIKEENFVFDKELNKWVSWGVYTTDLGSDILRITDLPYDVTYDKLEKKLNSYIEKGYIKDWKNFSHDDILDYRIQFPKTKLAREMQADRKDNLLKKMLLYTVINDDILYTINEKQKVKHFSDKYELLQYFVDFRLNKYNVRKEKHIEQIENKCKVITDICKFIELVTSGELTITNRKVEEVKEDLKKYNLPDDVLKVQVSKLTKEEHAELQKEMEDMLKEAEYIKNTTIKDMYLNDLKELRKTLKPEFEG